MADVVNFEHRGFLVALPASQIVEVGLIPDGARTISLFPDGERDDSASSHASRLGVRVVTSGGLDAWIASGATTIGPLAKDATLPLTDVLRALCRSVPHVVGATSTQSGLRWLVDLRRLVPID